ncbi:ABC-F family ATP-binding cassette domain-containing protein [Diplocloster agilis]|uniref:ABC-F family ATP-binding cassette domain-containing protein n=1 Tax=Diplocloster agilis TaxID=2850323 RepID=A0A949K669_9FIRM|nr:ABC-F family ATP-binding cassette domain-containing protein [Diplocloster agilis]MBU9738156.1 ABC-F family ATP-binding cassette domain-containing protein [Diplocloster agilis]MBU9743739.1 ABC-F family ATP-binding cassette domain-containing protein [Diplocloster agilis]
MNILNIEHVSKIYGEKTIFDDVSCGIHEGEKIGIIGINGTGKSTLLNMLAGLEKPDEGQIITQNGLRTAYLVQSPVFPAEATVLSYVTEGNSKQDWNTESEAKSILNRLGITDHDGRIESLSGGQKKKVALAKVLASSFDVLLLDEPTNHLDSDMIGWLEEYLNRYKGVVIMVTHDRYFLDQVTNKILEIDHGQLYSYDANYSKFLELKAIREEMEMASERKRQSVLRMELEWAKRGCRARSTKQRARLQRLEDLKNGTAPLQDSKVEMDSVGIRMGKKTMELHHISKSYGGRNVVDDFDYIVLKNQRLGIIGPNGCGKSTLLKIMAGIIEPDSGEVELGETIRIGYFAQEVPDMDTEQRVIDYIKEVAEYIPTKEGRISASQMLERFLFTPDMQYAPVRKLSGGEKKRLYLLKVICQGCNVLCLDEPGNDLDIPTLTILEDFLDSFLGIVITVSHDRYFLDNVVDRIFAFEGEGQLTQYEGGYTDYLETRNEKNAALETQKNGTRGQEDKKKTKNKEWKQNAPAKLKFSYKEQKEFETIDETIGELEKRIGELEREMLANATNSVKLSAVLEEKEQAEAQLEEKMERWVYLNDLAERIEAQKE